MMEVQFEQDMYYKSFSNQLETDDEFTLQQRIRSWMTVDDRGGPVPKKVFEYAFGEVIGF